MDIKQVEEVFSKHGVKFEKPIINGADEYPDDYFYNAAAILEELIWGEQ